MTIKTVRENAPLHQAQQTPLFPLLPQQVHSAPSMAEWGGAGGVVVWTFWGFSATPSFSHFSSATAQVLHGCSPFRNTCSGAWTTPCPPSPLVPSSQGCFSHFFPHSLLCLCHVFALS